MERLRGFIARAQESLAELASPKASVQVHLHTAAEEHRYTDITAYHLTIPSQTWYWQVTFHRANRLASGQEPTLADQLYWTRGLIAATTKKISQTRLPQSWWDARAVVSAIERPLAPFVVGELGFHEHIVEDDPRSRELLVFIATPDLVDNLERYTVLAEDFRSKLHL